MNRPFLLPSLLLGLVLSGGLAQASDTLQLSQEQIAALGLRFSPPDPAQAARSAAWPGRVVLPPDGHELLVAPLAGRITQIHATAGTRVQAGQGLLTLYSPALVQLVQDYQRARAGEDLARQSLVREQRLVQEGIGIERRLREAEIALRQAQAETRGLGLRLQLAGLALDHLPQGAEAAQITLRAPHDGALLMLDAAPGAWLEEGQPAVELAYTERRWVEAEVPLERATRLQPGQAVQLQPGDLAGKVLTVGLLADAMRQTVKLMVELEGGAELRPGMRVEVRFLQDEPVWRVAPGAIVRLDGQDKVFVQRGGALLPIPVVQQGREGDAMLVAGALQADDQVVSQGAIALKSAWQARSEAE